MMLNRSCGISTVETLIATPILLLLGLALLQWALVFQARSALSFAVQEAARGGAHGNAQPAAIESGMARGMAPYLYGSTSAATHVSAIAQATAHLQVATATGFLRLRMLSPTSESFSDWAVPARDNNGDLIAGIIEIPSVHLTAQSSGGSNAAAPASGVGASRLGAVVGTNSGQSLSDANLLKLEVIYGVPLIVPFIGPITARIMSAIDGCSSAQDAGGIAVNARPWACAMYQSVNDAGNATARLPVIISASVRMQTPARQSGAVTAKGAAPGSGQLFGTGTVSASNTFKPLPIVQINPLGAPVEAVANGTSGFLQFGADRDIQPSTCP